LKNVNRNVKGELAKFTNIKLIRKGHSILNPWKCCVYFRLCKRLTCTSDANTEVIQKGVSHLWDLKTIEYFMRIFTYVMNRIWSALNKYEGQNNCSYKIIKMKKKFTFC